jgi:hypothetical protein
MRLMKNHANSLLANPIFPELTTQTTFITDYINPNQCEIDLSQSQPNTHICFLKSTPFFAVVHLISNHL